MTLYEFTWWDNAPTAERRPTTTQDLDDFLHADSFNASSDEDAIYKAASIMMDYLGLTKDDFDEYETYEEIYDYFADNDWSMGEPIPMKLMSGTRTVKNSGFNPEDDVDMNNDEDESCKKKTESEMKAPDRAVLSGILGQLSDGYWENSPRMEPLWKGMDAESIWSHCGDVLGARYARLIKFIVKEEGLKWDRSNNDVSDWLTNSSYDVKVSDAYRVYDALLGRKQRIPYEGKSENWNGEMRFLKLDKDLLIEAIHDAISPDIDISIDGDIFTATFLKDTFDVKEAVSLRKDIISFLKAAHLNPEYVAYDATADRWAMRCTLNAPYLV